MQGGFATGVGSKGYLSSPQKSHGDMMGRSFGAQRPLFYLSALPKSDKLAKKRRLYASMSFLSFPYPTEDSLPDAFIAAGI